ncbi:hypothetical protein PybrP1_013102 [[Pythium] brassicae (nom. inval.)]|nr:hypothetical protein PybrP1_013102 [[Pythium] brassicae (nom. inval.)]
MGGAHGLAELECFDDARLCRSGELLFRTPALDCAFAMCADIDAQVADNGCDAAGFTCANGDIVYRDPANHGGGCPRDAFLCPGGFFVRRNAALGCAFDSCPALPPGASCPADSKHCTNDVQAQSDVHAWQDRFENARENVWLTLDEISRDRMALLRDLLDSQAQHDALTLIMYEYKRPAGTYTPAERQVVQNAFNTITRFSRAKAPVLPIWFLPLYDVAFEAQAARESAAVEVRRGAIGDAPVAVKIVRANVAETLEAFMHAVSAWFSAGQASPHVVRLHGASHVGEVSYVVEDVAGDRSLRDFMAREPQRLWGALHGAAQGLEVLHRQGVVHGRLETGGVVVAADGTAKITDNILSSLGLLEPAGSDDSVGMIENASGLGGAHPEPTVASDVLAFGACIMNALGGSEADSLSSRPDGVTVEQWGLLQRMCSERPDDCPVLADVVAQFGAFAEAERTPREAAEPAAWKEEPRREPAAASDAANQPEKASRQQLKEAEAEAAEPSQLEAVKSAAPKEEARRESAPASAVTNQPEKPSRQQVKEARKREKEAKRQERKARKSAKQDTDKTHCIVQ